MKYRSWGKEEDPVIGFTSSLEDDWHIWNEVVLVMKAHVIELYLSGNISRTDASEILQQLEDFKYDPTEKAEDVHEALESYLISKLGERGGLIGLGRSRNDHVATALRLKFREMLLGLLEEMNVTREVLLKQAEKYGETLYPEYTHFQPAQPSSFSHYLLYVEEEIASRWRQIASLFHNINRSPLGSGAIVGTNVKIDREREANMLGFEGLIENTLSATSSRADLLSAIAEIAVLMSSLSRIAEDLILMSSLFIDILSIPDSHVSTSSLMPHKRNAVTLEILRAKSGGVIGKLVSLLTIYKGLPSGYNLDLQEMNSYYWESLKDARESIHILGDVIKGISMKKPEKSMTDLMLSTDEAERRSLQGKPYRSSYFEVAKEIREGSFKTDITFSQSLRMKQVLGSPNPEINSKSISRAKERLQYDLKNLEEVKKHIMEGVFSMRAIEDDLVQ